MIEIVGFDNKDKWDELVMSFPNPDVYYLNGYVSAFALNGDGEPELFHFSDGQCEAICVMMRRDVADEPLLKNVGLPKGQLFDIITPYGYGGFIFDVDNPSAESINSLNTELKKYLTDKGYISAFFRFHPIYQNACFHDRVVEVIELGKTIAMSLETPEVIWQNITSKNRNMIRKAEKAGVVIKHGKGRELLKVFKEIYDETMRHDNAEQYYFFDEAFYDSIDKDLNSNYEIFYAELDGKIIAMSIMLYAGIRMHYHLSGSRYEYRNMAPSNLLLYKAAIWGCEHGYETLHLGGGVGSGEDNLYKFKAAFNRNSDYQFAIGKMIIDQPKYDELVKLRAFTYEEAEALRFFPKYRAER